MSDLPEIQGFRLNDPPCEVFGSGAVKCGYVAWDADGNCFWVDALPEFVWQEIQEEQDTNQ